MKKCILALFLLGATANAKPVPGLNDYGELLSSDKFSEHCIISDPGISGSDITDVYTNGQVSCAAIQKLYSDTYIHARMFFTELKYDFEQPTPVKTINLRILTLAQLNNPDNFSGTDSKCMSNPWCYSGAFYGRTFYSPDSSNINVYVVYPRTRVDWKFSFASTLKHELLHAILYRYQWNLLLGEEEHKLINRFLEWEKTN